MNNTINNQNSALKAGTLCEDEAKNILKQYGIPVVEETRVATLKEALDAASIIGFPVVIKGVGSKFAHKSEMGLVHVGIADNDSLKKAVSAIIGVCSVIENGEKETKDSEIFESVKGVEGLEGILVQPMIKGKRELVAGMFRDPQYGPVIMFGLGGIFTEALQDVSFRLAPLTDWDMEEMINEIASKAMLGNFRGEKSVNKNQIKAVLSGLSNLAFNSPEIREVDINPLIATSDGELVAVDALIVKNAADTENLPISTNGSSSNDSSKYSDDQKVALRSQIKPRPHVDKLQLASLFYPKTVAFVGASGNIAKWGNRLLTNALSGTFKGSVYPVNPKGGTIIGQSVYSSINDIEQDIDLAVITLPADKVLDVIPQLKAKNTKGMLLITSGFSETGEEGMRLEQQVVAKAAECNIIILGPNTMGICNPHADFACSGAHVHPLPGSTALVCQSGNMGTQLLAFAEQQGIGIRAFSGSGNEAMVTIEDYMDIFEIDEKTESVVLYIESVKDGRRFFESAKRVSEKKPVIVLSGGRTEIGGKAAASHTGALASNAKVTSSAFRQAGIIEVRQSMDLLDMSAIFSSMPLPKGNRVAIMTLGGGWGVVTADLCAEYNLDIPSLSSDIIQNLNTLLPDYWSHANPVDIVGEGDPAIPKIVLEELLKWDGCDAVIHLGIHGKRLVVEKMVASIPKVDPANSEESLAPMKSMLLEIENEYVSHVIKLTEKYDKPVLGVSLLTDSTTRSIYREDGCKYNGLFFPSPERAVKALAGMCKYSRWLKFHNGYQQVRFRN